MGTARRTSTPRRHYDNAARQAEARARQRRVVEVARERFLADGYAETTVDRIATEADVSTQLVYAAFGGKAGLLSRVVDVAAGGDDDEVLLRDRPEIAAIAAIDDVEQRVRAAARHTATVNARVGPVLHLVDSVAGCDAAVADLQRRLVAAMREDHRQLASRLYPDLRPDLGRRDAADMVMVLTGHRVWHSLVVDAGWPVARYERWLADALIRLLAPAGSPALQHRPEQ